MAYTDIDDPSDYFNTLLYTGDNSNKSFSGVGFQPDLTWIKARNNTTWHLLYDAVRTAGTGKELHSNSDAAEGASNSSLYGYLSSFDSDGFSTVNGSSSSDALNEVNRTYVAWNWKAGTSVSGNTTGSGTAKTYTGSVNTDAGFSIISFTGNGTSGHTIPHNLGVAPAMVILKRYDSSNNWRVGHNGLTSWEYRLTLEANEAQASQSAVFNSTAPTSSVVTLGNSGSANGNGATYIMYSFAEKQGYSKFGSFISNNTTDNTFVYCGFKPALVLLKSTTSTNDWMVFDNKRDTFNVTQHKLYPNINNAEATSENDLDFLSNGFKLRNAHGANTFIYMAIAENPFVTSTGVPATAR